MLSASQEGGSSVQPLMVRCGLQGALRGGRGGAGRSRLGAQRGGGRGGSGGDGKQRRRRQRGGREGGWRTGTKRRAAACGVRSSAGRQRGPQPGFSRRGPGCRAAGRRPCGEWGGCCGRRSRPVPSRGGGCCVRPPVGQPGLLSARLCPSLLASRAQLSPLRAVPGQRRP